jgi:hypothetical protein
VSFSATVYRVLIASPGDLTEEREVIEEVVNSWNASHADAEGIVLLPVRWETHAVPEYGDRAQAILNRRLVADCDILIGAFWTRVGTHTGAFESGTVEEIEQFAKAQKPALLYFSSREIDPHRVDLDQLKRVRELRSRLEQVALVGQFASPDQLGSRLTRDLIQQMRRIRVPAEPVGKPAAKPVGERAAEAPKELPGGVSQQPGTVRRELMDAPALGALYLEYWTRFTEVLRESDLRLRPPNPGTRNYIRLSLGSSDMRLNAFASYRDRSIGVELVLKVPACAEAYSVLKAAQAEIEQVVRQKLDWNELIGSNRIVLTERGFNIADRKDWDRQHGRLIEMLRTYQRSLVSRIEDS